MSKLKFLPILLLCGTAGAQNRAPCPDLTGAYGSFICGGARTTMRQQPVAGGVSYELNNDGKPQTLVANGQPQTITTSQGSLRVTTVCAPAYKPGITNLLISTAVASGSPVEKVTWMFVQNKALIVLKFDQRNGVQSNKGTLRCGPDVPSQQPKDPNAAPAANAPKPQPAAPAAPITPPAAAVRPKPTGPVPPADIPMPNGPRPGANDDADGEE